MDVVLLGTAGPEGFPVDGCGCARCRQARGCAAGRRPARLGTPTGILDAGPARLISTAGGQVLWAPEPAPLPDRLLHALDGVTLDAVVLGTPTELTPAGHQLARLRERGAVTDRTDVVLVGIGHDHPPTGLLRSRVSDWPARVVEDGTALGSHGWPAVPRRTLLLGPTASGKSELAEDMLASEPAVRYLATGPPAGTDPEWAYRLAAHRARRPAGWRTLETQDVATELAGAGPAVLLDAVGTWLTAALERTGAWAGADGWSGRLQRDVDRLVAAWRGTDARVVAVSEEVGWGVVPDSAAGRVFRDALGRLNRRLAAQSERVLLVVAGQVVPLTGPDGAGGGGRC